MDKKEYNRQYARLYHIEHRDKHNEQLRKYNNTHKSEIKAQRDAHRILNRDAINQAQRHRYLIKILSSETKEMSSRSESYYEKNKERIHEYYLQNKEALKQKALDRYYKKKEQQLQSGELIPKRAGRPSSKYIDPTPYVFKIEHLKTNVTE